MAQASTGTVAKPTIGKVRRIGFYVAVVLTVAAMAAYPPLLLGPVLGWLDESVIDSMFAQEGLGAHRAHLVGGSLLFWLTIVAMISQFRRPETKAAPLLAAVAAWVVFLPLELTHLVDPFSIVVTVLLVAVLALHPRRWPEGGFAWCKGPRTIAVAGTLAAAVYAYQQTTLQLGGFPEDPHVAASHYALMAVLAIGLAISALLGSTNVPGREISAWAAGIITAVLGVFFIGNPNQASSAGVGWGVAMVIWAVVYLWATTRSRRSITDSERILDHG